VLYEFEGELGVTGIAPDGATILFTQRDPETTFDIYSLPMEGGTPTLVLETPLVDYSASFSPDGRWMAYGSGQGMNWDVFVRPVAGGDRRWQINQETGLYPFWSPSGDRIYYVRSNGDLQWVEVDGASSTFRSGAAERFATISPPGAGGRYVSMHPDGDRILAVSGELSDSESAVLQLVTDWQRGLMR
jgi:Tol biopolymer transport system component